MAQSPRFVLDEIAREFEIEAKRFAGRIRDGGYLISVHCDDRQWGKRAEEILEATGGRDVVKTSQAEPDNPPFVSPSMDHPGCGRKSEPRAAMVHPFPADPSNESRE